MHVNLEHAEKAIEAARKKAIALKTQMCIAVVDSGANLKAFGAIGVSGSTVENDHAVAEAGVKVLGVTELPEHPWRT